MYSTKRGTKHSHRNGPNTIVSRTLRESHFWLSYSSMSVFPTCSTAIDYFRVSIIHHPDEIPQTTKVQLYMVQLCAIWRIGVLCQESVDWASERTAFCMLFNMLINYFSIKRIHMRSWPPERILHCRSIILVYVKDLAYTVLQGTYKL